MLFSDSYYTISKPSQGQFRERGSKFMAYTFPVRTAEKIKQQLEIIKSEHPSASHHCYAWRLGPDKNAFRFNDDGEPSGTAGKPIFSQILSHDLTNVLIVVVRYFGGSLLGVNGLIQAYRQAASEAIKNAEIVEEYIYEDYGVEFYTSDTNRVMRLLKSAEVKILSHAFDELNVIRFRVRKSKIADLETQMKAAYKVKLKHLPSD